MSDQERAQQVAFRTHWRAATREERIVLADRLEVAFAAVRADERTLILSYLRRRLAESSLVDAWATLDDCTHAISRGEHLTPRSSDAPRPAVRDSLERLD